MTKPRDVNYLKVVAKTFALIERMTQIRAGMRLSDLSRMLKQPKASVFRILYTLSQLGYVRQDPGSGLYQLTEKVGWFAPDDFRETLKGAARPFMERLLSRFEQTVNLGILNHEQILNVVILEGLRSIRMTATVNTYSPVHSTALGKSILCTLAPLEVEHILKKKAPQRLTQKTITSLPGIMRALRTVRRQGFAVDDEETEVGVRCVATPILDSEGRAIAAISISGPISHIRGTRIQTMAHVLRLACKKISQKLGHQRIDFSKE
jgi:IclR family acetate operon transcriptional repressor